MGRRRLAAIAILFAALSWETVGVRAGEDAAPPPLPPVRPERIVLVIADGTGWQQWSLLLAARRAAGREGPTRFERLVKSGSLGTAMTWPDGDLTSDSAAGATALATATRGRNGAISVSAEGRPLRSLLQVAREAGWSTGVVTDVNVTDATPAAFLTHEVNRRNEEGIATAIFGGAADVVLGGGAAWFTPAGQSTSWLGSFGTGVADAPSRRRTAPEADPLRWDAAPGVVSLVTSRAGLAGRGALPAAVRPPAESANTAPRVLGLFAPGELPWALDRDTPEERAALDAPSLAEMTREAHRRLSAGGRRYVLVVEAGLIDRACHFMDAGAALAELESLDETLGVLLELRAADPGLLVVLTADHETGGLAVGLPHSGPSAKERLALLYTQTRALASLPGARRRPGVAPPTLEAARVACPWIPDGARPFADPATDGRTAAYVGVLGVAWAEAASAAAGVVFASDDHSAVPVPVIAAGPAAQRFGGLSDLTVVGDHLRALIQGN